MKAITNFLFVILLLPTVGSAQPAIDTLRYWLPEMEVLSTYTSSGYMNYHHEETTYVQKGWGSVAIPAGEAAMLGDTLRLKFGVSHTWWIKFNADTTKAVFVSFNYQTGAEDYEGFSFVDAPLTITETGYEILLDSADLVASKFHYGTQSIGHRSGGTTITSRISSTGKFSSASTFKLSIKKKLPAAVGSIEEIALLIYPNPAHHLLTVSLPDVVERPVTIYDLLGRAVLTGLMRGSEELDVSQLRPGVYMLSAGGEMRKIIIE